MNINVVKKSNPFYLLAEFISDVFKKKHNKYIQIPATTSLNYVTSNYKKTEIDINKIEKQKLKQLKELVKNGILDIDSLTLEEIENLNNIYIKENEKILELNNKKRKKLKK